MIKCVYTARTFQELGNIGKYSIYIRLFSFHRIKMYTMICSRDIFETNRKVNGHGEHMRSHLTEIAPNKYNMNMYMVDAVDGGPFLLQSKLFHSRDIVIYPFRD